MDTAIEWLFIAACECNPGITGCADWHLEFLGRRGIGHSVKLQ